MIDENNPPDEIVKEPEATVEVQPASADGPLKIFLRKAIPANGEDVMELTFREPTGGDIDQVGNPVLLDLFSGETVKISFDARIMTNMMSRLAAVPPSSIRKMHPKDWNTAAYSLVNFFTPEL